MNLQDAAYEVLHNRYAQTGLDIILHLKGFYIKIGQIGATRGSFYNNDNDNLRMKAILTERKLITGDFVPPQYLERLATLQDAVPCQSIEYVKGLIEAEYGQPWDAIFSEIDVRTDTYTQQI